MAVVLVYLCSLIWDVLMLCLVPTLMLMYSKRGLVMSIKLHELNWVEVNGKELGSMRAAAAAAGWILVASLWPFLHFTASSSSLSSPSSFFSFTLSASPWLVFSSLSLAGLSLSSSPSSLLLHYWYRTHLWILPVSREPMTSLSLSPLPLSPPLSLIYLSASSLFLPLRLACW